MRFHLEANPLPDEEEPLEALPASSESPKTIETIWGLFDVLLKAPQRLDPFIRTPGLQLKLCLGFTVIALLAYSVHAVALWAVCLAAPEAVPSWMKPESGNLWMLVGLWLAYPVGIMATTLLVLPAYWYSARLVRLRMPILEVLCHSLKGKATTGILLLGLLPIYAVIISCLILTRIGAEPVQLWLYVGLLLPFLAGLRGAMAIVQGLGTVVSTTPGLSRGSRQSVPSSLATVWGVLFTAVTPVVMIKLYTLMIHI